MCIKNNLLGNSTRLLMTLSLLGILKELSTEACINWFSVSCATPEKTGIKKEVEYGILLYKLLKVRTHLINFC